MTSIRGECPICLYNIITNDQTARQSEIVVLSCQHVFHYDCISQIQNNTCPLCRKPIIENACMDNHKINSHFNSSYTKKNGKCTICNHFKYKTLLKLKIIEIL